MLFADLLSLHLVTFLMFFILYYTRPDSQFLCTRVYILGDFLWPEVQPHSDDSQMHVTAPCSARVLGQARPTMSCIF